MSEIFLALVVPATTAMNGTPMSCAKYASDTAVEPLEASTTGRPGRIHPLHRAWRNRERASRCLSDPVGCVVASLGQRSTPHSLGSGTCSRWVSEVLLASDCTALTASISQRRAALS